MEHLETRIQTWIEGGNTFVSYLAYHYITNIYKNKQNCTGINRLGKINTLIKRVFDLPRDTKYSHSVL